MNNLKERVTEKLSSLFADSPSSVTSPTRSPAHPPQARSYTNGGNALSSFFSHISFDAFKTNKGHHIKPIRSLPVRRGNKDFDHLGEPLDGDTDCGPAYESLPEACEEEEEEHGSGRSNSDSDAFEDAISPPSFANSMPKNLADDSSFISSELYEFLHSSLPNIVKGCQWVLLYSTSKHGISLRTLIRKTADISGHCLLIAGDMKGAVFGGLLECPLKPTPKRKYQGSNQTFVFTTIYGEPRLFRPTGANRYFYLCLNDILALGGGGDFALRLNEDLLNGTSGPSETFGNLCLAHNSEFELKNVELWGFTHSSRYLT